MKFLLCFVAILHICYLFICLFECLFVCLFVCAFVCLFVFFCFFLFVYRYVVFKHMILFDFQFSYLSKLNVEEIWVFIVYWFFQLWKIQFQKYRKIPFEKTHFGKIFEKVQVGKIKISHKTFCLSGVFCQ